MDIEKFLELLQDTKSSKEITNAYNELSVADRLEVLDYLSNVEKCSD